VLALEYFLNSGSAALIRSLSMNLSNLLPPEVYDAVNILVQVLLIGAE
jgi:hypothetical protein